MPVYEKVRNAKGWLVKYDGRTVMKTIDLPRCPEEQQSKYVINLKGTNGSGKSTVVFELLKVDQSWVYLTRGPADTRPIGLYSPRFNCVILGVYLSNCGGCDAIGSTVKVKQYLQLFWKKDVHILYEGVIVGDIRSTFYDLMKALRDEHHRWVHFCFMSTKLKQCLARVQQRNGGKPVNEVAITAKYEHSVRHLKWYLEQGDVHCEVLNTSGTPREVFQRFLINYPQLGAFQ